MTINYIFNKSTQHYYFLIKNKVAEQSGRFKSALNTKNNLVVISSDYNKDFTLYLE